MTIYSRNQPQKKTGESLFLRKLVLGIPAQASGKNLTRPLMPSAPRTSCVRAASPHHRKLGAGYATLPQMTGRCFGCNSRSPLALRTTGLQNYLHLPGTTSPRVRSPWLAAYEIFKWVSARLWVQAFIFGLIHCMGFAAVLNELGLQTDTRSLVLIGFNVGVEFGQLAIITAVLPLLFYCRKQRFYKPILI